MRCSLKGCRTPSTEKGGRFPQKRCQADGVGVKKWADTMARFQLHMPKGSGYLGAVGTAWSLLAAGATSAQTSPIKLDVDATDAVRKVLHSRLQIPVQPGKLTLLYPKWLPGDHSPIGPITDLVGLKMSVAGKPVEWRRDAEDMYAFMVDLPTGASSLEVTLDSLSPPGADGSASGASATAQLADISWSDVVLYPKGPKASDLQYAATLRLPAGWQYGTALVPASQTGGVVQFEPVSLETLVDSPVVAGAYFRIVDLTPGGKPPHSLHIVADSAAALELKPEDSRHLSHLVAETGALFGARIV